MAIKVPSVEEIKLRNLVKGGENTHLILPSATELENTKAELERVKKKLRSPKGVRATVAELMQLHGVNPIEEILEMLNNGDFDNDVKLKTNVLMGLAEFISPKLKAMEMSGQVDHTITVNIQRYGDGSDNKVIPVNAEVSRA